MKLKSRNLILGVGLLMSSLGVVNAAPQSGAYGCDQIVDKQYYSACYNYELKGTLFVKGSLSVSQLKAPSLERKSMRFFEETAIPARYRKKLSDYRGSGLDRGHLFSNSSLNYSRPAQKSSFSLLNTVPQYPKANRGIWKYVETASRRLAIKKGGVIMITGAVYDRITPKRVGAGRIAIPTHTYKIMKFGDGDVLTFLVPNKNDDMGKKPSNFKSSLEEVKKLTGFDFRNELR